MAAIKPEHFRALYENGIIGDMEPLDLADGGLTVTCGNFTLALSAEQLDAARELGIELDVAPRRATRAERDAPRASQARSDDVRREA